MKNQAKLLMFNHKKGLAVLHCQFEDGSEVICTNDIHLLSECLAADVQSGDLEAIMNVHMLMECIKALHITEDKRALEIALALKLKATVERMLNQEEKLFSSFKKV